MSDNTNTEATLQREEARRATAIVIASRWTFSHRSACPSFCLLVLSGSRQSLPERSCEDHVQSVVSGQAELFVESV